MAKPDADANYATYLDDLADNSTHTFTMTVTDFVGNSSSLAFDVDKTTDEFIGYLTGWNGNATAGSEYDTINDDGNIQLDDAATSATFLVSFITEVDYNTLNPDDFNITYSSGPDDDIAELSIEQGDIVENSVTTGTDNDYLITVKGGNLPLAAGAFTLAFAADQDIETADGGTVFDLSLIADSNQSFSYFKDFSFGIDSLTQPNHGTAGAIPDLEVSFTAPDTGTDPAFSISGYKLYYTLDASSDPDTSSPYFSTTTTQYSNLCLPILVGTSQGYSFRVVAEYYLDGDSTNTAYETHIDRGSTMGIELNATLPTYTANTTNLALPFCERVTFEADDVDILENFGRGLALSRDSAADPLRNLVASGEYQNSSNDRGGAIRHYGRAGAEFAASPGSTASLELIDSQASEFGHNLAFPTAAINNYDLFIAGDPFYTTDSNNINTGYVQLYHKASTSNDWSATNPLTGSPESGAGAAGAAVAIAVNGGNAFALYGEPRHETGDSSTGSGRIVLMEFDAGAGTWSPGGSFTLDDIAAVANDSLFGSAIAVTEGGEAVAVMSSQAVYIFSLNFNGSLGFLHAIAASDFIDAGGSLLSASVNSGQALALQKTELNNSYLLAIGLPHDSDATGGIIYGAEANKVNTISGANRGGVLLLTTSTTSSSGLSSSSTWRQLAYLRSDSPANNGFYGSNLLLVNPEQPTLLVSEPKLAYGYNTATNDLTTTANTSNSAQLHIYYLNTDGADAADQEHLIFSPDDSTFISNLSDNQSGYAYAFDYANNSLALSSPSAGDGEVSLYNLFTALDLSGSGAAPKVLSSLALDDSTNTKVLSFGVRFPATVDSSTIDSSDFEAVVTSSNTGATALLASDISFNPVSGSLDYWQVTLNVDATAVSAGKAGEVRLAFASGAEIKSSTGKSFDLAEFNTSASNDPFRSTSYQLDYDSPALASIERLTPSLEKTNSDSVTFRLSFSKELNTSTGNGLSSTELDYLLDDYFSVVATAGVDQATFGVAELSTSGSGDEGIDVNASYVASTSTTMDVAIANIDSVIYNYTDNNGVNVFSADSIANFQVSLYIEPSIVTVLGDFSGNALDSNSLDSPTGGTQADTYSIDYKAPTIANLSSSLSTGYIDSDATITYSIAFSEDVQPLVAGDFEFDIDEASNSAYGGGIDFDTLELLHEIFGGSATATDSSLTNGSGYEITPIDSNTSSFTLTIAIEEEDFLDLISEPFNLKVLTSVTDVYGNTMQSSYDDTSNKYTINFNQFSLDSYSFTISDSVTGTLEDGNYTSHLNIFSFLNKAKELQTTNSSDLPSFGYRFNFTNPVDRTTVELGDFAIQYGGNDISSAFSLSLPSGSDGSGTVETTTVSYNFGSPDITFSDDNKSIFLEYNLTPEMLEYGFDLTDELSIAIKSSNSIFSSTSGILAEGSQPLFYSIKAAMPLLVAFEHVDGGSASRDDAVTSTYQTFTYSGDNKSGDYYGFRLRYSFSEDIVSAVGRSDTKDYTTPSPAYYLAYSNSASLLDYTTQSLLLDPKGNLIPNKAGEYGYFADDGALVQQQSGSTYDAWEHLVYLTDDESNFLEQTSEHNYSLTYDADYISGYSGGSLPVLLGGYGSSSYSSSTSQDGTFFLDADGNPARIDIAWVTVNDPKEPNSAIALTFDTKTPVLTGVTALYVEDGGNDGIVDDYNGGFGTYSDEATFAFELTFDKEINRDDLESGLEWSITGGNPSVTTIDPTGPVSSSSGFVYTVARAFSGLYNASGDYSISFSSNTSITDSVGNEVNATAANNFLSDPANAICASGTCSYVQTPVVLSGFSVDPETVLVLDDDTSHLASFDVYLTFSEPVSHDGSAAEDSFNLNYQYKDSGDAISASTIIGASTDNTIQTLEPITSSQTIVDTKSYYTEYHLSIEDKSGFWAIDDYLQDTSIGKANTVATIFFEQLDGQTDIGGGTTFLSDFVTSYDAYATLPGTIQTNAADSGTSQIKYNLLADFEIPEVPSDYASVVAASGNNVQGDGSSKRHVQFQLDKTDSANQLGVLFLFRTTDNAFTHTDPDTAPYYGAEGGIFIDDVDNSGYGYHICPPFNKHINRAGVGAQHPNLTHTYNENIIQIHYLAIPYAKSVDDYLVDQDDIDQLTPLTVSFADALNSSEPCVRTAFYNDGEGQYGYVVDSDMEEQHMVIANAMLQDQSGDSANLAMLPKEDLQHVYFDLYAKDYTADSWRRDQRITANDLLADLSANINSDALHNTDDLSFQISETYLSIFASRFVNTINARFLDSVFLDDLTHSDIPITAVTPNNSTEVQAALDAHYDTFTYDADNSPTYSTGIDTLFNPNLNNANPDGLAAVNDNRIVLSIGVHPAAISVDVGSGYFQPFESNQANFLKMAPELYDLYYGGDSAAGTEPGLDYTSRHLAYVNFDLVYDLTIDPDTQAITAANLVHIVSPFTLLQHSFFSATELEARAANGETYSAVAVSIADNVFRHNFNINDQVQHFLPYGVYCYNPINTSSSCYNPDAQMLLPNPTDAGNHARTEPSQHNLHRGVLYLSDSETYTISGTTRDSANDTDLLSRFMRINHHVTDNHTDPNNNFGVESYIGSRAHTSMLYNSFDRAYGLDYTFSSSSESFANGEAAPDGSYTTDALEQAFWAVSPYSESPDARADQILPNAFFLGNQDRDFLFNFIVKPYQYTGFTQQVQSALADPEYLVNKNINMRFLGLTTGGTSSRFNPENTPGGLNYLPVFAIPSADISATDASSYEYITGSAVDIYSTYGNNENALILGADYLYRYPFYISHIIHDSPQNFANHILLYQSHDQAEYLADSISRYFLVLPNNYVPYFAGRAPGFLADKYSSGYSTYFLSESTLYNMGMGAYDQSNNTFYYDFLHGGFYNYQKPHIYNQLAGRTSDQVLGTVNSSVPYDLGKSTLPHHEDDIDFDRGQISSHKLGFQLDNTQIFDYDDKIISGRYYAYTASTVFFPSNPALVTGRTQASDTIAIPYDGGSQYHGIGEVGNYYPAVQSQESLYTEFASTNTASASTVAFASYPTIIETISIPDEFHISNLSSERAYDADGRYLAFSNYVHPTTYNTYLYYSSTTGHFTRTIPLDKIFPEGYSYQLGFINREELFMYSPEWIASGSSGSPEINRFYSSSVGNFGYATQFSRLNRRAMKKYHMATSSQFLGDHLARFTSTPASGVQTPSDLDSVFDHTPREQGATATAYGSYAAGYYDVQTSGDQPSESSVPHSSSFQSRWVTGTLRGYVLELRTSPLTDDNYAGRTATSGLSHSTSNNEILGTNMEDFIDTYKGAHPDP